MFFCLILKPVGAIQKSMSRKRCQKELAKYEEKRKQILEQLRSLSSEYGCIRIWRGEINIFGTDQDTSDGQHVHDKIPLTGEGNYFTKDGFVNICRGEDPARFLVSTDVMILRTGRYKKEAAKRIIESTRDKLKAFDNVPCLQISAYCNYLVGFSGSGKVVIVRLDLPVAWLFKNAGWWCRGVPCYGDVRRALEQRIQTSEEIVRAGGFTWTIETERELKVRGSGTLLGYWIEEAQRRTYEN